MFKISFLVLGITVLIGCSSSVERQFMKDCTQGQGISKSICSCLYDKLENNYGDKAIQAVDEGRYIPDDFEDNMMRYAESCR